MAWPARKQSMCRRHSGEHSFSATWVGQRLAKRLNDAVVTSLAKAEREGTLRERLRFLARASLLVVDEIGYLPVVAGGGNLFFQLVNARYEKGAMILTSNRGLPNGVRSSAIRSSLPHCSTACCTMPSLSRSRDRVTGCGSTPPSCQRASGRDRSSPSRHSRSAVAAQ
jgi:hypothetical protein